MMIRVAMILSLLAAAGGCQNGPLLESSAQAAAEPGGVVVPTAKPAQAVPAPPAPAPPDAAMQLDRLLDAVQQLQQRVDQLQSDNTRILAALGVDDQDPSSSPAADSLARKVADLQQAVMLLSDTDAALRRAIEENRLTLRPPIPEPTQGRLTVDNHTGSDRQIWINGSPYWIWAGSRLTVSVPVGEITTKVAGEEAKTWQIHAPRYEEHVQLVRAADAGI